MLFGDVVRKLLEEHMISQKEMAQVLNISPSTLGNYIRNLRQPDFDTIKKIAGYFSVSTDYLLDYQNGLAECSGEEKELVGMFRTFSPEQKRIYLEQGRAIAKINIKEKADTAISAKETEN